MLELFTALFTILFTLFAGAAIAGHVFLVQAAMHVLRSQAEKTPSAPPAPARPIVTGAVTTA
jgi:hypothetical protein